MPPSSPRSLVASSTTQAPFTTVFVSPQQQFPDSALMVVSPLHVAPIGGLPVLGSVDDRIRSLNEAFIQAVDWAHLIAQRASFLYCVFVHDLPLLSKMQRASSCMQGLPLSSRALSTDWPSHTHLSFSLVLNSSSFAIAFVPYTPPHDCGAGVYEASAHAFCVAQCSLHCLVSFRNAGTFVHRPSPLPCAASANAASYPSFFGQGPQILV